MAITASDLVGRALQMMHEGLGLREIGKRLVDIAQSNGHDRVEQSDTERNANVLEIKLIDTGVTVYFDGRIWGHTLEATENHTKAGQVVCVRFSPNPNDVLGVTYGGKG